MSDHTVPLPDTAWTVYRDVLIRSAGFPAAGLNRFTAPGCAKIADAFLDGAVTETEMTAALTEALTEASRTAVAIVADPLFREAVTWQNPAVAELLGHLAKPDPENTSRRRQKRRSRENTTAQYWQRYCGKNDTIGFFGPVAWGEFDPAAPAVVVRTGPGLTRSRQVYFEFWALEAYAARLAADPVVRPWLPVAVPPHLTVTDDHVLRPGEPPLRVSAQERALLARCDGRPATRAGDATLLERLAERGLVRWGVDMPYNPDAEGVLRTTLTELADPAARERALTGLHRLDAARAEVAAAAGDPDRLAVAMAGLDTEFTAVTGAATQRRAGQMYAGRRLCYEETVRDIDLTFGGPVLDALAGPFGRVLLPAARWVSAVLADTYAAAFAELFDGLREPGAGSVPLAEFWQAAQALLTGTGKPADAVAAEFARRWSALFEVAGAGPVTVRSEDLAERVAELFPADRPRWPGARIHSPDLHLCASSVEALERGDFTIVLGEMHSAWPTMDSAVFTGRHPDPDRLRAAAAADIGPQFRPLYPTWWPGYTARIAPMLGVTDHQLAFADAPGADPRRVLAITALAVTRRGGELVAATADGQSRPLNDVFALLVGWLGSEVFKLAGGAGHIPRITVDKLVVTRETWRTTVAGTGLAKAKGALPEYLAARRLRRELGLPDRVFAKLASEVKPTYVDFTSPRYVSAFATMLRGAGPEVRVVFTELLPSPELAWLPDAEGRGYYSELRIQFRDPARPEGGQ